MSSLILHTYEWGKISLGLHEFGVFPKILTKNAPVCSSRASTTLLEPPWRGSETTNWQLAKQSRSHFTHFYLRLVSIGCSQDEEVVLPIEGNRSSSRPACKVCIGRLGEALKQQTGSFQSRARFSSSLSLVRFPNPLVGGRGSVNLTTSLPTSRAMTMLTYLVEIGGLWPASLCF